MFWKRGATKSSDRLRDALSRPVGSLRTRYSLATAFNRMLETISARAVSVANLEQSHRALINGLPDAIAVFAPHPYDGFLAKPYTMPELRQVLGEARGKRNHIS